LLPLRIRQTLKQTRLEKQIESLWNSQNGFSFGAGKIIIGKSPQMYQVFHSIKNVAWDRSTALIMGESGTGKELVAQAIHAVKGIPQTPFVSIDCGTIQRTILESELFGVRAKYPGFHNSDRLIGKFELAGEGTLLLDEIGNMEVDIQVKLLRVLEERQFMPYGYTEPISLKAQVIASTNIKFDDAIRSGKFREDLYHRLNDTPIVIPPLRDRREDIPLLVNHFLEQFKIQTGRSFELLPETLEKLKSHDWPGNVRELAKTTRRAITSSQSYYLTPKHFDFNNAVSQKSEVPEDQQNPTTPPKTGGVGYKTLVKEFQKAVLLSALKGNDWNQTKAAEQLQISRNYLLSLLKSLKISEPKS
ncbi:MAG: sigma-54 dependent transcriptional regulator, partial [Candidatus Manganitrophaceae bacterium]